MTALNRVMAAVDRVNDWVGKALYPTTLLICLVIFTEILLRYAFNRPTLWSFETTQFLFIFCTMLSAGHLHLKNGHVNVDILYSKFSERTKLIVNLLTFPFFLLFIGAMTYFGLQFGWDSVLKGETTGSAWDPPVYPVKLLIPVGAALLLLQGFVNILRQIQSFRNRVPGDRN